MFTALPIDLIDRIRGTDDLPGWASVEKKMDMAALIVQERPQCVVEIGIHGGRSLIPQALALQHNGSGLIYGIDPYAVGPTQEGASLPETEKWWINEDFEGRVAGFLEAVKSRGLEPFVRFLRLASRDAVSTFADEQIDIIHVDGCHSTESACEDVTLYLPKVKSGGYVWLDDTNWQTVVPALNLAKESCDLIKEYWSWALLRKK